MDKIFLSCDWGTSSFRLRLINTTTSEHIGESYSDEGVAKVYDCWLQKKGVEKDRFTFYTDVLKKHISKIQDQTKVALNGIPIIISGMASSTIGIMELPYKQLPVSTDISDLPIEKIERTKEFDHTVLIISGLKTDTDIMRGEEVQLLGCSIEISEQQQVFIFPGTHSKHIVVENGQVSGFETYMTGEFFHLLSEKSILSKSISAEGTLDEKLNESAFEKGVSDSLHSNLLHQSFMIRTNDLFQRLTKSQNYWYLSGLLVGTEINSLLQKSIKSITIVSDGEIARLYEIAFKKLDAGKVIRSINVNEALINAHISLAEKLDCYKLS